MHLLKIELNIHCGFPGSVGTVQAGKLPVGIPRLVNQLGLLHPFPAGAKEG